jgi:hypothetical protein
VSLALGAGGVASRPIGAWAVAAPRGGGIPGGGERKKKMVTGARRSTRVQSFARSGGAYKPSAPGPFLPSLPTTWREGVGWR